jgi:hypothetical protein
MMGGHGQELQGDGECRGLGSGLASHNAGARVVLFRIDRIGKSFSRGPQKDKQFAGPKQNIQQPASFQITQALALEAKIEGLAGALFDERSQGSHFLGLQTTLPASRINALELLVASEQVVTQAKILLSKGSNRRPFTRIHSTVPVPKHRR